MSARLWLLAGAFACGVLLAEIARPPPVVLVLLTVVLCVAAIVSRALPVLVAVVLALGCMLAGLKLAALERSPLARGAARGADALLEGEILGDPRRETGVVRFTLAVTRAEIDRVPLRLRARARVTVRPPAAVRAGDLIRVDTRLRPVGFDGMDAGARASAARLTYDGVSARAFANAVEVTGRTSSPLARVAEAGRDAVRRAASHLPDRERGLLQGVTIGDTSELDPSDDLDFRTTGLSHLVAVSGANVAYVLAMVAFLLRLARTGRRTTVAVMAATVVGFVAIARYEPSVMRAGVMASIALAGVALGARRRASVTLAAATLCLLVADPFMVHAPGFQLSVLATAGILFVSPKVAERLPQGRLTQAAAVTIGAQLAVAPLLVLHFGSLSLISIVANVAAGPMVGLSTVIGLIAAGAGAVGEPLAALAVLARPALAWMLWVADVLAELPLASVGLPGGIAGLAIAVVLGLYAVRIARARSPMPSRRRTPVVVLCVALVATGGVWARALGPPGSPGLLVTMFNVGQGDALLVQQGEHAMLIDGGPDERQLLAALAHHRVRRLDLLVISHPHADHIDGLVPVAERFPVARAVDPYIDATLPAYGSIVDALGRRRIPRDRATAGMRYRLGAALVEILWPPAEHMTGTENDVDNNSIVLRVRYGEQAAIFAGETAGESQGILAGDPQAIRADVLKVAHHGSRRMDPAFYAATGARVALIPVGVNTYGHPTQETLAALEGMRVTRSDLNGEVRVGMDGSGPVSTWVQRGT